MFAAQHVYCTLYSAHTLRSRHTAMHIVSCVLAPHRKLLAEEEGSLSGLYNKTVNATKTGGEELKNATVGPNVTGMDNHYGER